MGLGVRILRGLAICCLVLGGTLVGTAIVGVASSGAAFAQSNSIDVKGNRRVETSTVRSYFKPGPGGRLDRRTGKRGPQGADRHRPVRRRAGQSRRRPAGHHRGRKSGDQPRRLRRQQESQRRAAQGRSPVEAARDAVAADRAGRRAADHRNLSPQRPLRRHGRSRRSSICRTTASIWSSKSTRARKPASRTSISSAPTPTRPAA